MPTRPTYACDPIYKRGFAWFFKNEGKYSKWQCADLCFRADRETYADFAGNCHKQRKCDVWKETYQFDEKTGIHRCVACPEGTQRLVPGSGSCEAIPKKPEGFECGKESSEKGMQWMYKLVDEEQGYLWVCDYPNQ